MKRYENKEEESSLLHKYDDNSSECGFHLFAPMKSNKTYNKGTYFACELTCHRIVQDELNFYHQNCNNKNIFLLCVFVHAIYFLLPDSVKGT